MTSRRVLLARPHDFVVETMREFLTRNGYEPVPVTRDEDLAPALKTPLYGAVVSTAVVSPVKATVGEVYRAIRAAKPLLPLALASLAGFDSMRGLAQAELGADAKHLTFLDVAESSRGKPGLSTSAVALCLPRDALTNAALGPVADRLITTHFVRPH